MNPIVNRPAKRKANKLAACTWIIGSPRTNVNRAMNAEARTRRRKIIFSFPGKRIFRGKRVMKEAPNIRRNDAKNIRGPGTIKWERPIKKKKRAVE